MGRLAKVGLIFVSLVIALLPMWFWLLVRWLIDPGSFLGELLLFGVGIYILGSAQVCFLIVWLVIAITILISDDL